MQIIDFFFFFFLGGGGEISKVLFRDKSFNFSSFWYLNNLYLQLN